MELTEDEFAELERLADGLVASTTETPQIEETPVAAPLEDLTISESEETIIETSTEGDFLANLIENNDEIDNNITVEEKIQIIQNIAEETHPGTWDFAEIKSGEFNEEGLAEYRLVLHFPEITIKNRTGLSHKIFDFYVQILFNDDLTIRATLYCNRATISILEYSSEYVHSHSPRRSRNTGPHWRKLCLGTNTPVGNAVSGIIADEWNPSLLTTLLIELYSYVSWESLEGGPYIRMSSINNTDDRPTIRPNHEIQDFSKEFDLFVKHADIVPFKLIDEEYSKVKKVEVDPLLIESHLAPILLSNNLVEKIGDSYYHITDDNVGRNASESKLNRINDLYREISDDPFCGIIFKGENVQMQVFNLDSCDTEPELVPHPDITRYVTKRISEELSTYLLNTKNYESN